MKASLKKLLSLLFCLTVVLLFSTLAFADEEGVPSQNVLMDERFPDAKLETANEGETTRETTVYKSGSCGADGDNVTYTFYSDGKLVIEGTGDMANYDRNSHNAPWYNYAQLAHSGVLHKLETVEIKNGVTSIGDAAFMNFYDLTEVSIPSGVTCIGDAAFMYCLDLINVSIPSSVTSIGEYAFFNCYSMTEVIIPDSVSTLGGHAFDACFRLTNVTLPDSLAAIGDGAFASCSRLTSITFPKHLTTISMDAFRDCGLQSLEIPDSVTSIGIYAFSGCNSLTSVTIPGSLSCISDWAFYGCSGLTNVTISEGVSTIGREAFRYCGLQHITLPESLTKIDSSAFCNSKLTGITIPANVVSIGENALGSCDYLKEIVVAMGNTQYASADGCLYTADMKTILLCPEGKTGSISLPNSVTTIAESAFYGCSLSSITIPASITSIGAFAFRASTSLTEIDVSTDNKAFCSIDGCLYTADKKTLLCCPGGKIGNLTLPDGVTVIGEYAFSSSRLTSVTIPAGVTSIPNWAFGEASLKRITLPKGLTHIGQSAFYFCRFLTEIIIPDSVISIGPAAFYFCYSLEGIAFAGDIPEIADYAFGEVNATVFYPEGNETYTTENMQNYGGTLTWKTYIPEESTVAMGACGTNLMWKLCDDGTMVISGTGAMEYGYGSYYPGAQPWYYLGDTIKHLVIEDGATNIPSYAFYQCASLIDVSIPASVTTIGGAAFFYCGKLERVSMPEGLNTIGSNAFAGCESLTSVTIPGSVIDLGAGTFMGCLSLDQIEVAESNTNYCSVDGCLFNADQTTILCCPGGKIGEYSIPETVCSVGNGAFAGCEKLTKITIPSNLISIGNSAFSGCYGITSIIIPENVADIGVGSFSACISLEEIVVAEKNTNYCSLDGCLFSADGKTLLCCPAGRSGSYIIPESVTTLLESAFTRCANLTSITIPNSVSVIPQGAFFGCSGLTSIVIPQSVTSIGRQAFSNCTSLTSIRVPASVTLIDMNAFSNCSNLRSIIFEGDLPSYSQYSPPFADVTATVYYPEGNQSYVNKPYFGGTLTWVAVPTPDCILPTGLLEIEEEALADCAFRYVFVPDSMTTIGKRAFADSPNLAFVYIPASVTTIEADAFDGVENLTIFGDPDSYAETFATAQGITFVGN